MLLPSLAAILALAALPGASGMREKRLSPRDYYERAGLKDCPDSCELTGLNPANWTIFANLDIFLACKKPKLFSVALNTTIGSPDTNTLLRSCVSVANEMKTERQAMQISADAHSASSQSRVITSDAKEFSEKNGCRIEASMQTIQRPSFTWSGPTSKKGNARGQFLGATRAVQMDLLRGGSACESSETIIFAHYGKTTVGLYSGARIQDQGGAGAELLQELVERVKEKGMPTSIALQLCGGKGRTSEFTFGVIADATSGIAGLANVQKAVQSWSKAKCFDGFDETASTGNVTLSVTTTNKHSSSLARRDSLESSIVHPLQPRAECRTTEVVPGEGCWAVAQRCGITTAKLEEFNGGGNFCNTLIPGQTVCCSAGTLPPTGPQPLPDGTCSRTTVVSGDYCYGIAERCGITLDEFLSRNKGLNCDILVVGANVCCSTGGLPDLRPPPSPDGSCATYTVQAGDTCEKIAAKYTLPSWLLIAVYNAGTWGFNSCSNLMLGATICLSMGNPPMPAPISNAVCGPQVPGTQSPAVTTRSELAKLNPCPLNVCCNIWGNCGTTADFCTETGTKPGESAPGTNGCISNCGTEIVNNSSPPKEARHIAYFEAWNRERPCLYMDISEIDLNTYTDIHFAFVDLNEDYTVSTRLVQTQFDKFKAVKGARRIAAFGGWTASTHPSTFHIFRNGVLPENRLVLATNLAAFIVENDLDGIDIDWEYPAAQDMPDIPSADPLEGNYYRDFLAILRLKLPVAKSISIAAPASYWYLRGFPIADIAKIVNYIVYMTYDLHGQWDYGSAWSQEGCPGGDCLRSHVNTTETQNALVMITKAGVPANKVIVGVSSYGRSFRTVEPGCTGPNCKYIGSDSAAAPGRCTGTRGYVSNAEINTIMNDNSNANWFHDDESGSDILLYNDHEWVAFMNDANKGQRTNRMMALNFGGTTDWAVDLQKFQASEGGDGIPKPISAGAWKTVPCTVRAVRQIELPASQRWAGVGANHAWADAVKAWRKHRDAAGGTTQSFSIFISDFFHSTENMNCGVVQDDNGCKSHALCKDFEGVDDTGPAAYFIHNSFVNLSSWLWNLYQAVGTAINAVPVQKFSQTFAHRDRDDDTFLLFMIINVLTAGFTMGVAPIFNHAIQNAVKGEVLNNAKDVTLAAITLGGAVTKDYIGNIETDEDADDYVEYIFTESLTHIQKSITNFGSSIFSGSDESLRFLNLALSDGKLINAVSDNTTALDMQNKWTAAVYSSLISHIWHKVGINPVIIDTGAGCEDQEVGVGDYISSDLAGWANGCVDERRYYLVGVHGPPIIWLGEGHFLRGEYSMVKGTDTINNGNWIGLSIGGMIKSAVEYKKIHGKNKAKKEDGPMDGQYIGTHQQSWDALWNLVENQDDVVSAPGVIDIPVCSEPEAREYWIKHHDDDENKRHYSYPCAPVPE